MPDFFHYVYVSYRRDTRQFYIGCRTSKRPPEQDIYFGSGTWVRRAGQESLEKEILKICPTRAEALRIEMKLIMAFRDHPLCMNEQPLRYPKLPKEIPPPPPGLCWPPQYHETYFRYKRHGIKVYIEEHWRPFIDAGLVDMTFIRAYYPTALRALYTYRTKDASTGKPYRPLPPHLTISPATPIPVRS